MHADVRSSSCDPFPMQVLFGVTCTLLVISLSWNIYWGVSRCSEKGTCQSKDRQRQSLRRMEENPIYGNLSYMQTSMPSFTATDPPPASGVDSDSQPNQDCYANLTLKAPRLQSVHSSPQTQYSDVFQLAKLPESPPDAEDSTEDVPPMSDLYASVQTQRSKVIVPSVGEQEYANHL
ncbi:signaling threshold-regulating transmembrane adapter 1-like [Brachionichthys hirsutus]|uniref:signaling threshold-regulating transmembrane adapter 1-like n=1 Tax=Brachionichthys hirsutus TaxID=412623 RepID=UPI00360544BA